MVLKNKTAIVTGASDGLGREVALALGIQGVNLALVARRKEKLEEVKKQIKGVKVGIYPCDVKELSQIKSTVNKIIEDFGTVDILLNIAGIWQKKMPVDQIEEQVVDDVIATNLTGLIHITRLVLPVLRKQKESAIVNVASSSGTGAGKGESVYAASKWGVRGFTNVLRVDLKGTNVKVTGIYQRGVKTMMFEKVGDNIDQNDFNKFINPKDLANAIVFILSQPKNIWLGEARFERG